MIPAELNEVQIEAMFFIKWWANTKKTPIPQRDIIKNLVLNGVKSHTVISALNTLLLNGYIRRAYSEKQNRTYYVMIRNI